MSARFNRRTATKVRGGRVQRKNRHRATGHDGYVVDRESPGCGFRHVVTKQDVRAFIDLIPEWERYSERLERIVLAAADDDCYGFYQLHHRREAGVIFLHAWDDDLWVEVGRRFFDYHRHIFDRIGVSYDCREVWVPCRFTEAQARAFMLLHVFMHELGHHYDYIQQKHLGSNKGEDYAERFANNQLERLFPAYVRVFGHPAEES